MFDDLPRISVGLRAGKSGRKLVFRLPDGRLFVSQVLKETMLQRQRARLAEDLKNILGDCRTPGFDVLPNDKVLVSLERLRRFSSVYLHEVFDPDTFVELHRTLVKLLKGGLDRLLTAEYSIGLIEYKSNLDDFIPLDYLLMPFDLGWQPKGRWGCMVSLGQVLGMAFLVQRCVSDPLPVGRTIEVKDKFRVEIFADKSLEEVEQEMAFFRNRNQRHFVASNSDDCPKNPGEAAVQWLMTKLLSQPPAHFHHYACHCSTDSVRAHGALSRLRTGGKPGQSPVVS